MSDHPPLRQGVLAVSVLEDIEIEIRDTGVALPAARPITLTWDVLAQACGDADPLSGSARRRLTQVLRVARALSDAGRQAPTFLADRVVVMALPPGHVDHLGEGWKRGRIPGGSLDLGLALRDVPPVHDDVVNSTVALPPALLTTIGIDHATLWPLALRRVNRLSNLAAERLRRHHGVLRPMGGCDVLTLLTGDALRRALADGDGTGMRAIAVPNRTRGWFDLRAIDPAYVNLAWRLTDEHERGLPNPVLVTRDEVLVPRPAGLAAQPVTVEEA